MTRILAKDATLIHIIAYQPDIAQNLGNMIRTAACFGIPIGVIEPAGFPFSVKALRRSAMDYAEHAEIHRFDDWEAFKDTATGRRILLTTKSDQPYTRFEFQPGDRLIVGRESAGVPDSVAADCHAHLTIPMPGHGRSLNVSNAAAMVTAEALRQLGAI